jgi:hypothetical protein
MREVIGVTLTASGDSSDFAQIHSSPIASQHLSRRHSIVSDLSLRGPKPLSRDAAAGFLSSLGMAYPRK